MSEHDPLQCKPGAYDGFQGMDVRLEPILYRQDSVQLSFLSPEKFQRRKNQLRDMRDIASTVPGLIIPGSISESSRKLVLKRAHGINLSSDGHSIVGSDIELQYEEGDKYAPPLRKDYTSHTNLFLHRSPEDRLQAAVTYLRAISAMNKRGLVLKDHKRDSVFVGRKGVITLTDFGMFNSEGRVTAQEGWRLERSRILKSLDPRTPGGSALTGLLAAFMNRDLEVYMPFSDDKTVIFRKALPFAFDVFITRVDDGDFATADEAANALAEWLSGTQDHLSPPASNILNYVEATLNATTGDKGIFDPRYFSPYLAKSLLDGLRNIQIQGGAVNTKTDILFAYYKQLAYAEYEKKGRELDYLI